jgi:hypothetical protein
MQVRVDDRRALERAWSAYAGWLAGILGTLPAGSLVAVELTTAAAAREQLVPSVDIRAEADGRIVASATGNRLLGPRHRMRRAAERRLARTWSKVIEDDRGVVLWELERQHTGSRDIATGVSAVLAKAYRIAHPVCLRTTLDGDEPTPPDWRRVHSST